MNQGVSLGLDERPDDFSPPYDVVVFDCDSTLADLEGIDWLARDLPAADLAKIEAMTNDAMSGVLSLEEVFGARLELIHPDQAAMERLGERYVERLLLGALLLVDVLHYLGKEVHIVSGGLKPGVLAVAKHLGIRAARVHAVGIEFDDQGAYKNFDVASPLARKGGKPEVLAGIAKGRSVCLIGDGLTDLEAAPECARFIAFGAVVRREAVFDRALVNSEDRDLVALIPLLTSSEERATIAAASRFVDLF